LIPCGEKSEEIKKAIQDIGYLLSNLNCFTVYFSQYLIKVYYTKVAAELKQHHPLPPFQSNLLRLLPELVKITHRSRGFLCKTRQTKKGIKFHILENTHVQSYDVNDVGLIEEEDKEVIRIALASAPMQEKVFLVTADRHLLEDMNRTELLRRYCYECQKIEIVAPNDCDFMSFLVACSLQSS
jgi:hypothetical protein